MTTPPTYQTCIISGCLCVFLVTMVTMRTEVLTDVLSSFVQPDRHTRNAATTLHGTNERSNESDFYTRKSSPQQQYLPPPLASVRKVGKKINVSREMMTTLRLPETNFSVLNEKTVKDFVFVIGASSNHFSESRDAVAGVQTHMPGYKILYYDLGLKDSQIKEIKAGCNVIYRKLNFEKYPKHVKRLDNYAFKPLIVQEVLREYRALVWMDASFRLLKNMTSVYPQILETGGVLQFWPSPHSNFAVTDKRLYDYIPTDVERQKSVRSRAAGAVYWHRTESVYWDVFYWWVICALDEDCIAPSKARLGCNFKDKAHNTLYADCHRFDMSVLNVLMANCYGYDHDVYTARDQEVVTIEKHATKRYIWKTCG